VSRPRLVLLGLVAAAVLAWGVERLIVTDAEAIETLLEDAADAVARDDWDAASRAFDDDFRAQSPPRDREQFLAWARSAWTSFGRPAPTLRVRETSVSGDEAAVLVRVTVEGYPAPIDARLECVRRPDGWRVARLVEWSFGGFAR
jgi:hypothetical protein